MTQNLIDTKNEQIDDLNRQLELEREKLDKSLREFEAKSKENLERLKLEYDSLLADLNGQIEELKRVNGELKVDHESRVTSLSDSHKTQLEALTDQLEQFEIEKTAFNAQNESFVSLYNSLYSFRGRYFEDIIF
jgi:hypothetical protein